MIKQHTIDFPGSGSGGTVACFGGDMPATRKGMNISPTEYIHVVDDILQVLDKNKTGEESKKICLPFSGH